jgi:hypothetical protein
MRELRKRLEAREKVSRSSEGVLIWGSQHSCGKEKGENREMVKLRIVCGAALSDGIVRRFVVIAACTQCCRCPC